LLKGDKNLSLEGQIAYRGLSLPLLRHRSPVQCAPPISIKTRVRNHY